MIVVEVMTGDARPGPPVRGRPPVKVDIEALQLLFDRPQPEAASSLGISLTSLKLVCRKLGMTRWPYRRPHGKAQKYDLCAQSDTTASDMQETSDTSLVPPDDSERLTPQQHFAAGAAASSASMPASAGLCSLVDLCTAANRGGNEPISLRMGQDAGSRLISDFIASLGRAPATQQALSFETTRMHATRPHPFSLPGSSHRSVFVQPLCAADSSLGAAVQSAEADTDMIVAKLLESMAGKTNFNSPGKLPPSPHARTPALKPLSHARSWHEDKGAAEARPHVPSSFQPFSVLAHADVPEQGHDDIAEDDCATREAVSATQIALSDKVDLDRSGEDTQSSKQARGAPSGSSSAPSANRTVMKGRPPTKVDLKCLEATFNWPYVKVSQPCAAKILGISLTTLKQVCRRLGVSRWPYRRECAGMRRAGAKNDEDSSDEAATSDTPPPETHSASPRAANGLDGLENLTGRAKVEYICGPDVSQMRGALPQEGRAVADEAAMLASARVRAHLPHYGALSTLGVLNGDTAQSLAPAAQQGGANSHLGGAVEDLAVTARSVALLQDSIAALTGAHTQACARALTHTPYIYMHMSAACIHIFICVWHTG